MVITTLAEGRYVEVNDAYARLLGYEPAELLGQTFPVLGLGHSEERNMVVEVLRRAGKLGDIPLLLRTRDGETRTAIGSVQLEEIDGQTYLVSMIQDLTDHERVQSALRSAESRFRIFFQSIPLPLLVYDVATLHFVDVNPAACRQYGYTHDEFMGLSAPDLWLADTSAELATALEKVRDPAATNLGITRHRRKDGTPLYVDVVSYAFTMEGRPVRLSIAQDVTEQRMMEAALRASEERLRIIADVTTDAMWDRDLRTDEVKWSQGLRSLFGYDLNDDMHHDWWSDHVHPDEREAVLASIEEVFASDENYWATEYRFLAADGRYANVLDRGYVIRDEAGRPTRFIGAMVDITTQVQVAEAAARAAQEERQRLARDLHEAVTQSLYSASLMAEAARRHAPGNLSVTGDYISRLSELSQQALRQLRLLVYELRPTLLEQEGLVGALRHRLEAVEQRAGIQARLIDETSAEIPRPLQSELFWIAQEALNNSLKHAAATTTTVTVGAAPEDVWLEVRDNGCGFAIDAGRSNGRGLNRLRERVARLGGQLEIESEPGGGTVVRAYLVGDGQGPHNG
jgi:PAS domain S-box-containing protein